MIYYGIYPPELVLEGLVRPAPEHRRIPFARGYILAEVLTPTSLRIVGLISSEIQDYLEPRFQPGRIIDLLPGSPA